MRLVLVFPVLLLLTGCGTTTGMSNSQLYGGQGPTSMMGSQGGGGVETTFWSSNPNQKTDTNLNPSQNYNGD